MFSSAIRVRLSENQVDNLIPRVAPGVTEIVANLLRRQQRIADGKVEMLNIGNLVGVNVRASLETAESVPYLTHLDFNKAIRELTDVADYAVLNLS